MNGFTRTPNWILDSDNGLTNAEFRVLMCIYRLTAGFHRNKYKIPYLLLTKMTGIKGISIIMHSLKRKGLINFESETGKSSVITILKPVKSVNRFPKKVINSVNHTHSVSESHPLTHLNGSRGDKEKIKENLKKELFIEFKKKYPEDKFDDDTVFDVWQSLTDADKQLAVGVMEYQNNRWDEPNFNRKFIPKASNYILKQLYLDDDVKKSYEDKLRREKEAVERRRYIKDNEENSATDDEVRQIMDEAISQLKPDFKAKL